jgi:transcriptional regulator GlxA family with amidase domain
VTILIFDEVELLDVAAPLEVLSVAGRRWNFRPYKVELVAPTPGLIATRSQARIEAPIALADATPPEILIVPGGYGARRFSDQRDSLDHLARLAGPAELVAGIGAGVLALARASLIGERRISVSLEREQDFEGLVPSEQRDTLNKLVEAERLITTHASGSALDVALAIVRQTLGPKLVTMVATELGLELDAQQMRVEIRY